MIWRGVIDSLVVWIKRLGAAALVGMMAMTVFDVITRAFGTPIFGAVEIVSLLAVLVLACAMPITHVEKGHVGVDLIVLRLGPRARAAIDSVTAVLGAALFALISWQMFLYARSMKASGEVSMSMELPTHYLIYAVAVAFGVLTLVILVGAIDNIRKAVG